MTILEIQSLHAGYGSKRVLENIQFTLQEGQFVSVVAPNGSGKSTLLKTTAGVLPPLSGSILLQGKQISRYSRRDLARQIAVVSSEIHLLDYTAYQMVSMGRFAHIHRFSRLSPQDQEIVQNSMKEVGIWHKRHCLCNELSQGERQKVIIARALSQQPKLLLLDEPTAHLDIGNQYGVLQLIKNLACRKKLAVLAVIHDINLALEFSTELLFLYQGKMLAYGKPQEVATSANLKQLYGLDFSLHRDAAATYVRPILNDNEINRRNLR